VVGRRQGSRATKLAGLAHVAELPGFEEAGPETVEAILERGCKVRLEVLAPINAEGDAVGCTCD
jgi:3-(methylthio)propanoyl-CoA dehydrogenase